MKVPCYVNLQYHNLFSVILGASLELASMRDSLKNSRTQDSFSLVVLKLYEALNRDFTDKPNRNHNRIECDSDKESKGDINISVRIAEKKKLVELSLTHADKWLGRIFSMALIEILMSPLDSLPDSVSVSVRLISKIFIKQSVIVIE